MAPQSVNLVFHHVGVVTPSLEASAAFYEKLGYRSSARFDDPRQKVSIVLLTRDDGPMVELVSPLGPDGPAVGWIRRIKVGPYHTCYEVHSITDAIAWLREAGFAVVSEPVPAVAFEMRLVAFLWSAEAGLVELLERSK